MKIFKFIFIAVFVTISSTINTTVYITEVINNTDQVVSLAYPSKKIIKIITCKSITSGSKAFGEIKDSINKTEISLHPKTITSLEGANIPNAKSDPRGYLKTGISIGFGKNLDLLTPNGPGGGKRLFTLIRQRNNWVEKLPKEKFKWFCDKSFIRISQENLAGRVNCILEIDPPSKLKITPRTNKKIGQYSNPTRLSAQEFLHQSIVNDSIEDINKALETGANINMGKGNQPPLLLAILLKNYKAMAKLLEKGANPNIKHLNKSILFYLTRDWNLHHFALLLLKKRLNLSQPEKKEIVDLILFKSPYKLNKKAIKIIKKLDYDIKTNFENKDLTKNKWYNLLVKHSTGTRQGKPFGHAGLPRPDLTLLFLKNGANPNHIFELPDKTTWTPLLLVIDNYIQANNEKGINKKYYQTVIINLLSTLLKFGANINQQANVSQKGPDSPLSYALSNDKTGFIIDFLSKQRASIEEGVSIFLKNGGSPNKKINSSQRSPYSILLWAIENNNPKAVKLLIEAGANANERVFPDPSSPEPSLRNKTQSLLQFSIIKGYSKIMDLLISHGAR